MPQIPDRVVLTARHPGGDSLKEVVVDGKPWPAERISGDRIDLGSPRSRMRVELGY